MPRFRLFFLLFPLTFSFAIPKEQPKEQPKEEKKPSACISILNRLAPKPPPFYLSVNAYAQTQKDIVGTSTYTAPVHVGLRADIPILDTRELYERQLRHLSNLQNAQNLLSQYLSLRAETEELSNFLEWMNIRVEYGIEYKKDVWQQEIALKQKIATLKSLESFFHAYGITKKELDECFYSSK
ncbi:MAG: hypothetical protein JHC21_04410 [Thermocrinis sp.]|nr:hypothetical protein [Thermocrinis sp.]